MTFGEYKAQEDILRKIVTYINETENITMVKVVNKLYQEIDIACQRQEELLLDMEEEM